VAEHKPERWTVHPKLGFVTTKKGTGEPTGHMKVSCAHRASGACGGCYARFYLALKLMLEVPEAAAHIAKELDGALDAEAAARRLQGKA
jgi:hypothetical protein